MTETQRSRTPTRLLDVDALRGFALFGILVVNLAYFASGYPFHLVADPAHGSWRDDSVEFGVRLLFEMKFYLLFSFLFGYSFTLQLAAAGTAGANFTARFVRRLGGLFVLGGLHAVLLFQGAAAGTAGPYHLRAAWPCSACRAPDPAENRGHRRGRDRQCHRGRDGRGCCGRR
ncbi:hypothetical protein [Streptomyces sp. enrichment culture]|uniref:hypothetical protein n=1 Tax=Streptomyces sp. enrichment culture TaxID=1795815 RepID=UPI003F55425F